MTALDLDAIKASHATTTQLEWEAGDVWVYTDPVYPDDRRLSNVLGMDFADNDRAQAEHDRGLRNAIFIAEAHRDVPALVAEVERQAAIIAAVEALAAHWDEFGPESQYENAFGKQVVSVVHAVESLRTVLAATSDLGSTGGKQ